MKKKSKEQSQKLLEALIDEQRTYKEIVRTQKILRFAASITGYDAAKECFLDCANKIEYWTKLIKEEIKRKTEMARTEFDWARNNDIVLEKLFGDYNKEEVQDKRIEDIIKRMEEDIQEIKKILKEKEE